MDTVEHSLKDQKQKNNKTKNTKKYLQTLKKYECPDTTYVASDFPIVMKKSKGVTITDVDNKKYFDFTACFGVLALGHQSPTVVHAVRKQLPKLIHGMGDVHPSVEKIKLIETLAGLLPYKNPKIHLSLSGGDAVETAIKTAMLATGKSEFLVFDGSYHGLQFGPLSLNHRAEFTKDFSSWTEGKSTSIPFPLFPEILTFGNFETEKEYLKKKYGFADPAVTLEMIENHLKTNRFAGFFVEPVQGRGGKRSFTKEYIQELHLLCQKYKTLLIFDEIYTGFGRTGNLFGFEMYDIIPDIICLGKALGGGFPLSACCGDVLNVWKESKGEAMHTQTFLGHPLFCSVARKTILEIQKKLQEFQKELIQIDKVTCCFIEKYKKLNLDKKFPFHLRGHGFMKGLWFYKETEGFCVGLMEKLLEKGFIVLPEGAQADVLSLTPPLIMTAKEFQKIYGAVVEILLKY